MEDHDLQHISLALYQYMCQNIIGSKETVKTKRLLMAIDNNMTFNEHHAWITSGSIGEGLEMKGSDFDYMIVIKDLQVHENVSEIQCNPLETCFTVITEDTKPGFVKLLLLYCHINDTRVNLCVESEGSLYLSNQLMKSFLKLQMCKYSAAATEVNHGPCLSDKEGMYDIAICVHLRSWISQTGRWMTRPNSSWPYDDVKSRIIEHGVLFVPVGVKGSPNEEIELRISFSVGEKLLINSFTHTQLLCYALMKIILKDIINTEERCKDLLCSYYIKNIIFWISEELPLSIWKPQNLISCFMRCFQRLIYCIQYSLCPHYFIPANNMFENKIEGHRRRVLLDRLNELYDFDWQLKLLSQQLQDFLKAPCIRYTESQLFICYIEQINFSAALMDTLVPILNNYNRSVKMISAYRTPQIKSYHQYYLSKSCLDEAEAVKVTDGNDNRRTYDNYKLCQSYLLQNLHHDAVSGWLRLASLFYSMKQYRRALDILFYALSKCSKEKMLRRKLSCAQLEILKSKTLQSKGLFSILKFLRLEDVWFILKSNVVPKELELEISSLPFCCSVRTFSIIFVPFSSRRGQANQKLTRRFTINHIGRVFHN